MGANLLLIPRFGVIGAAWSNTLAYGVLAATAMRFSQRAYPMRYEWRRIGQIVLAGAVTCAAARVLIADSFSPLTGLLLRGGLVAVGYPVLLLAVGFFEAGERERLQALWRRFAVRSLVGRGTSSADETDSPLLPGIDPAGIPGSAAGPLDEP